MLIENKGRQRYFKSELLSNSKKINHAFTTKCGGVSYGKIEGLNLGFRCGDITENVLENYKIVAKDMEFPFERITTARQTHSANIRIIKEDDAGKGVSVESDIYETDGLITNCKMLPLVIFYADCVPILLADELCGVVAAVHSGWRGTVSKIIKNAVDKMQMEFGSNPENIKAVIGPSIGPCCFECGADVAKQFDDDLVRPVQNLKFKVDLWQANKKILLDCGVKMENIDVFKMCTICNNDILYSYRSHGDATGRMGAIIMLK